MKSTPTPTKITAMQYDVAEFLTNSDGASEILDVLEPAIDHIFGGTPSTCEALKRYAAGEIPEIDTDVDGIVIAGYGDRGTYKEWEFQLPDAFYRKYVV
jgi:hypothetical protein